jgi:TonB family protein
VNDERARRAKRSVVVCLLATGSALFQATARAQESFEPARFVSGQPPKLAPLAPDGGLVVVELVVASSGIVQEAVIVDDAAPYSERLKKAVRLWKFSPAREDGEPVTSRVALVGVFRAPVLMGGSPPPPSRVARPTGEVPYPTSTSTPSYPPQALDNGVVMLEVEVDENGAVRDASVLSSGEGFTAVALEAARKFRFDPAEREGRPVPSYAVLVFGFPQPVTSRRRPQFGFRNQ